VLRPAGGKPGAARVGGELGALDRPGGLRLHWCVTFGWCAAAHRLCGGRCAPVLGTAAARCSGPGRSCSLAGLRVRTAVLCLAAVGSPEAALPHQVLPLTTLCVALLAGLARRALGGPRRKARGDRDPRRAHPLAAACSSPRPAVPRRTRVPGPERHARIRRRSSTSSRPGTGRRPLGAGLALVLAPRPAPGNSGARPPDSGPGAVCRILLGLRSSSRPAAISSRPGLSHRIQGPGRLYVSPALPRFDMGTPGAEGADALFRSSRVAASSSRSSCRRRGLRSACGTSSRTIRTARTLLQTGWRARRRTLTPVERDRLLGSTASGGRSRPAGRAPALSCGDRLRSGRQRSCSSRTRSRFRSCGGRGAPGRALALSETIALVRSERFDSPPRRRRARPRQRGPARTPRSGLSAEPSAPTCHAEVDAAGRGVRHLLAHVLSAWKARLTERARPSSSPTRATCPVRRAPGKHRVEFDYDRSPFRRGGHAPGGRCSSPRSRRGGPRPRTVGASRAAAARGGRAGAVDVGRQRSTDDAPGVVHRRARPKTGSSHRKRGVFDHLVEPDDARENGAIARK